MPEILQLNDVARKFDGFELRGTSFTLAPGYIMGLIGPNGSGKTTIIKLIMNMIHRDKGTILVNGIDAAVREAEVKKRIGYVSDDNIFVEEWKPTDVAQAMEIYFETFSRDKFASYLKQFELPKDKRIKTLSRGMKTRLMLAAVLSRDTKLLLLDEPTSGLDPSIRAELLDILQDYISDGTRSVLFSTHITTDLEKVADFVTFVNQGKLLFTRNKDDVLEEYRIAKGSRDKLTDELKQIIIGLRVNQMGFEGLVKTEDITHLSGSVFTEPASLDDIVVYHTAGGRQ